MLIISTLIFFIFLISPEVSAQDSPWDQWDAEVIDQLYTSRDLPYMSEEEQKVILFMNMARYDGKLFAETFLKNYVEEI